MIKLRPDQADIVRRVDAAWGSGRRGPLVVMPTGAGKTVTFCHILSTHSGPSAALVHRRELISQISVTLARFGVRHSVVTDKATLRAIVAQHVAVTGESWVSPLARVTVVGVDTMRTRGDLVAWAKTVRLVVVDEAHHTIAGNKWGNALELFPGALRLGVTATPLRADGIGLDAYFDDLIVGPSMRDLITAGSLCDYEIYCPRSDLDLSGVRVTKTGDYSPGQLSDRVHKSHIVGDVVANYLKLVPGKKAVLFATDIEIATEHAARFNDAGVPAAVISSKNTQADRDNLMRKFARGDLLVLTNVDLFGEGLDVPDIEAVIFARPTASYGLFVQQFGRGLRASPGKSHAIIIDHVSNVIRHGLPDAPRSWSLSGRDKRARVVDPDELPLSVCASCTRPFLRHLTVCPHCDAPVVPSARSGPAEVNGDLIMLDAETLARLRGEVLRVASDSAEVYDNLKRAGAGEVVARSAAKNHRLRAEAIADLREVIAAWSGVYHASGECDRTIQKRFFITFGLDILSAQTLPAREAVELAARISNQTRPL